MRKGRFSDIAAVVVASRTSLVQEPRVPFGAFKATAAPYR